LALCFCVFYLRRRSLDETPGVVYIVVFREKQVGSWKDEVKRTLEGWKRPSGAARGGGHATLSLFQSVNRLVVHFCSFCSSRKFWLPEFVSPRSLDFLFQQIIECNRILLLILPINRENYLVAKIFVWSTRT
jgi:hypothetical protein